MPSPAVIYKRESIEIPQRRRLFINAECFVLAASQVGEGEGNFVNGVYKSLL